jgi:cell division protein FtsN
MSRDYKARREAPPRRRHGGGSGFFWFATGSLVGALAVAVAWMLDSFRQPPAGGTDPPEQAEAVANPRFDYHSILPEMEVVVPEDELADLPPALPQPATPPRPAPSPEPPGEPPKTEPVVATPPPPPPVATTPAKATPVATGSSAYLLQVASLRNPADAERLKAKLALLGVQAQIQRVTINGNDTYHRVRVGPYRGKEAVNRARALLSRNGLESLAIKLSQ